MAPNSTRPDLATNSPKLPLYLNDLVLPPDMVQKVDCYCTIHNRTGPLRRSAEEQFRLRYFYGGHFIIAVPTNNGLQIHAIDLADPDEIQALNIRLHTQGHSTVLHLHYRAWDDPEPEILTPLFK